MIGRPRPSLDGNGDPSRLPTSIEDAFGEMNLGNLGSIQKWIDSGGDLNAYRGEGTMLLIAMKEKWYDIALALVEGGANVGMIHADGQAAFHFIDGDEPDEQLLKVLSASLASPTFERKHLTSRWNWKDTPMTATVDRGCAWGANWLIGQSVSGKSINSSGYTALSLAFMRSDIEIMKLLLENGAHPHDIGTKAYWPMAHAGMAIDMKEPLSMEIFGLLIDFGGDIYLDVRGDQTKPIRPVDNMDAETIAAVENYILTKDAAAILGSAAKRAVRRM